jgi:hypothetical protein
MVGVNIVSLPESGFLAVFTPLQENMYQLTIFGGREVIKVMDLEYKIPTNGNNKAWEKDDTAIYTAVLDKPAALAHCIYFRSLCGSVRHPWIEGDLSLQFPGVSLGVRDTLEFAEMFVITPVPYDPRVDVLAPEPGSTAERALKSLIKRIGRESEHSRTRELALH